MGNRERVGGFILAGGRSSRMGRPKGILNFADEPMVVHIAHVLESTEEARDGGTDGAPA
ncbi:MAG: molybdenum cofactor guanylyltransferase, partial [Candidatus Acidiferrales bacterium]